MGFEGNDGLPDCIEGVSHDPKTFTPTGQHIDKLDCTDEMAVFIRHAMMHQIDLKMSWLGFLPGYDRFRYSLLCLFLGSSPRIGSR